MTSESKQISVAATAIALRGVRLFLTAGKTASDRQAAAAPQPATRSKPKKKQAVVATNKLHPKVFEMLLKTTRFNNHGLKTNPKLHAELSPTNYVQNESIQSEVVYINDRRLIAVHNDEEALSGEATRGGTGRPTTHVYTMPNKKLKEKHLDILYRLTHFSKPELEALYSMYRRLVTSAQAAAPATAIGHSPKIDGIDQSTFRDVMHNTFDLVTEEAILERMWITWERGAAGGEGSLRFESWVRGLSVLLRGNVEEKRLYCFKVYDLNNDGYITRDEMFSLLRNALLKQPGDEDPDEGVRDLVELVLRKLDVDKDGRVSIDDYRQAVEQEPLLLEAFGQCLPSKRHSIAFLKTLVNKN